MQPQARAVEAMMAASRTLTAIVARTLHDVVEQITVPQLRVLVLLDSRGPMNMSTIARHLDVNPSNASRTCDQLVASGQVTRDPDPTDRRHSVLRLTPQGTGFVAELMSARRELINAIIGQMSAADQAVLASGLETFLSTVSTTPDDGAADMRHGQIIPWLM